MPDPASAPRQVTVQRQMTRGCLRRRTRAAHVGIMQTAKLNAIQYKTVKYILPPDDLDVESKVRLQLGIHRAPSLLAPPVLYSCITNGTLFTT